jgi:gluconolactonase
MQPDGAIFRVDGGGAVSQIAVGIDDPNFVTIAPDGSALVSDDFDTRVFRVTLDGEVSEVLTVESPNGMAYSPDGQAFYVASTFTVDAQLTRFDVDAAGLPVDGSGLEILHLGQGTTPDGIAVSADNQVYVAANLAGEIWRVDGAASELQPGELVASLAYPASLAFGVGPDFDPCSLYVTPAGRRRRRARGGRGPRRAAVRVTRCGSSAGEATSGEDLGRAVSDEARRVHAALVVSLQVRE